MRNPFRRKEIVINLTINADTAKIAKAVADEIAHRQKRNGLNYG